MPKAIDHAYGYIKKAAAIVNLAEGRLPKDKADLIIKVSDEIIDGRLDDEFPLYIWQTGSGTQTNMNVNEVISNRAIDLAGGVLGSKDPIHPNDHVNMSQSSNDTFPAAMHIATVLEFTNHLFPNVEGLINSIKNKALEWMHVIKLGRTHLQDAIPLTVGKSGLAMPYSFGMHWM
jgi:fumarate hydratase class II